MSEVKCKYLAPDGKCKADRHIKCHFNPDEAESWFDTSLLTIDKAEICGEQAPFGNNFFKVTPEQLEDLRAGRVLYSPGEYGTFIILAEPEKPK